MDTAEATSDLVPFEDTVMRVQKSARFAGEVYRDARGRVGRKWRVASSATRKWTVAAALGLAAVLVLSGMLFARPGHDASVEISGEPEVSMRSAVRPVAPVVAAPKPAPVDVPRPTSVMLAPAPPPMMARAAPVAPVHAAVKAPVKVTRTKLTKKALAAKKKAAKRAAAARRHRSP